MPTTFSPGAFGALEPDYCQYEQSRIAILPIPYDRTTTWQKGSDNGPAALLAASANMELYDIETDSEVYRQGITTIAPIACPQKPEDLAVMVAEKTSELLNDGKFVVGIGGEHSISIGLVQAHAKRFPDLSVLQLDAHSDLRDEYEYSKYNHACVMARIQEICPIMQVGIRSMDISELPRLDQSRVVFAHEFRNLPEIFNRIAANLTNNVYLTVDLDVFDPAVFPSTGTPEPGGLGWYDVITVIASVIQKKRIIGMDVNELLPNPSDKAPDFLAAKLIYRTLSMIYAKESKK
ncbi:MAG TPA: agmatinase [Candidatus Marinimicrobia bacterium]|nr:agmatinase [Candidatus Neomarinimicrobiota bacterium]HRU92658.1 agmatinase [Candidatus Neomarinimicrobiota bacterium]